jgi:hypothetical protein
MILSCGAAGRAAAEEPLSLTNTVHLLLDDYLIHQSDGVERKVIPPSRFLPNPIVTGAPEHQNWQPFLTVLHDPERPEPSRFRMWYNADVVDDPADGAFFGKTALLESADGVHWPGPYERLNSLAEDGRVRFGANVLDEGRGHEPLAERYKMLYFCGLRSPPTAATGACTNQASRSWPSTTGTRPARAPGVFPQKREALRIRVRSSREITAIRAYPAPPGRYRVRPPPKKKGR